MGKDQNETPRKPRLPHASAPAPVSPFGRRSVQREPSYLADVVGALGIIEALVAGGRAIMFSKTRDGGAWCLQVLDGDQRWKSYASSQAELNELFLELQDAYGADAPE